MKWWQDCNALGWASSRCRARSNAPGVGWTSGTPCLLMGLTTRGFVGCAAPATWLFLRYTRLAYRRLAGKVARDIGDYTRSGQSVQAVVGVRGSPSCGVRTTLDLKEALETIARCDPNQLNTDEFSRRVIVAHARPGQGMFIAALRRQLRGLDVPFDEHDLIAEITH
jgi:hypothetical protein